MEKHFYCCTRRISVGITWRVAWKPWYTSLMVTIMMFIDSDFGCFSPSLLFWSELSRNLKHSETKKPTEEFFSLFANCPILPDMQWKQLRAIPRSVPQCAMSQLQTTVSGQTLYRRPRPKNVCAHSRVLIPEKPLEFQHLGHIFCAALTHTWFHIFIIQSNRREGALVPEIV